MKINHVLIQTTSLDIMSKFFKQVIGLDEGYRPLFPFQGTWIYANDRPIIHLAEISKNKAKTDYLGLNNANNRSRFFDHVALEGANYNALMDRLKRCDASYFERTVPESQEHQVFINGPENVKIEMIFNQHKTDIN